MNGTMDELKFITFIRNQGAEKDSFFLSSVSGIITMHGNVILFTVE